MDPLVKQCVDAKKQVFETYFDVPPAVAPELNALFERIDALGEGTNDAATFEARFQAELQTEYNGMFQKVTPRPVQMTKEEKEASRKLAMELTYGSSDPAAVAAGIAKDVAADAAGYAATELHERGLSARRQAMIASGTYGEYTRISNAVDDARRAGGFLSRLFGKKKQEEEPLEETEG